MEYITQAKESKIAKQQKTHTREIKVEAEQLVKSSDKPMSQITLLQAKIRAYEA